MKKIIVFTCIVFTTLFGADKIKTLDIEPSNIKYLNAKFIEANQTGLVNLNSLKKKKVVENDDVDILDNIMFSSSYKLKKKINNKMLENRYGLKLTNIPSNGSIDVLNKLRDSKINIGVLRGDVLGIYNNNLYGFEKFQNYGILCSTSSSLLYLVSKKNIKSIYELREKKISTGSISNIAQIYLNDMLQNTGIVSDVKFRSYNFDTSLRLLKKDKIGAIFIFGDSSYISKIKKDGLVISSIPSDALIFFKKKQGLIPYSYKIKNRTIYTFKVPNYLVAPVKTLDLNISQKIEAMVDEFKCYKKIQNIDPFYGAIHPDVKDAIARIRARNKKDNELIKKLNSITVSLKSKKKVDSSTQYIYEVSNNSKFDTNITFDYYRTKLFDETAIKPRHVLSNFPKGVIEVKAKADRLITFIYKNDFTTKVKNTNIVLVFKDLSNQGNFITTILNIGDDE